VTSRDALSWAALWLLLSYLAVVFGVRSWLQWRRTGSTGYHGISGRPGSAEWWGGVLLAVAFVAAPLAAILDLAGAVPLVAALAGGAVRWTGLVLVVAGFVATFAAQVAMGASWRVGVKADEITTLVTSGPFAIVRNPIFAAMLLAGLGLALLVPNTVGLGAWLAAFLGIELQVRFVEEPYLLRTHGEVYRRYAARVGRLVPWLGRQR
jgi:protein-S-isoprenylcysteine O-methyltransferase Ste14